MKDEHIGVTVCLSSNEGILDYDAFTSQFRLYYEAGVPVSLATDDEGISRTNLTEQYAKAAMGFGLGYVELKELAYNAIDISLIDESAKSEERTKLDTAFADFERKMSETRKMFESSRALDPPRTQDD
jgi:adenosine deaminase